MRIFVFLLSKNLLFINWHSSVRIFWLKPITDSFSEQAYCIFITLVASFPRWSVVDPLEGRGSDCRATWRRLLSRELELVRKAHFPCWPHHSEPRLPLRNSWSVPFISQGICILVRLRQNFLLCHQPGNVFYWKVSTSVKQKGLFLLSG